MPIHDFNCKNCLYVWEEIWSVREYDEKMKLISEHLFHCPECNSVDIQKFVNKPGIKFKGKGDGNSGFYALDYALPELKDKEAKKRK